MPTLLYYEVLKYQPANLAYLAEHFEVLRLPDPGHDTDEMLARVEVLLAPLGWMVDAEKMDRCPNLRVIGSNTTGIPHIDAAAAASRGVRVAALHDQQEFLGRITPTAEHAWGLLLALTRRTPWAFQSVTGGTWDRRLFPGRRMLSRMSLGIVGLGRLGSLVAGYGRAFGMAVHYYNLPPKSAEQWLVPHTSLASLVESVDVVSLHVPLNEQTEQLIDEQVLARFRPGSYLINTARAQVVDEAALLRALASGHLAGAAVDVLTGEYEPGFPRLQDNPMLAYAREHDNLLLTPHIGGSTQDAWEMTERRTLERVVRALQEEQP